MRTTSGRDWFHAAILMLALALWSVGARAEIWNSTGHAYGCGCNGAVYNITGTSKEDVCQQAAMHATSCQCYPPQHPSTPSVFSVASYSYTSGTSGTCRVEDTASQGSTYDIVPFAQSADPPGVYLSSSQNPAPIGRMVTYTATVVGTSPTGSITFKDGTATLAVRALASGIASLTTSTLALATHPLTAVYAGDANNSAGTSSTVTQSITQATTSLALNVWPLQAAQGENVTLMARVDNGYLPTGTMTFSEGTTVLGTASVTASAATLALNNLALGSHTILAAYAGDVNNTSSASGAVATTIGTRAGMAWQYGYDAMGRVNTLVDPNGHVTYVYYDSLGRPIQTQEPPNTGSSSPTVTQFGWNLADGLKSVADPRSLLTSYTRNGLGDTPVRSSPDTNTSTFTYDANGNVLTSTDARGKTTTFSYDGLDRLTGISYSTGTATAFEYDGGVGGAANQKGELTKITDESGQTVYTHDARGRLTGKTVTIGTKTFTVGYSWGNSGTAFDKLTAITYPSGSRVNYSYDAKGYVTAITVNPVNPNGSGQSGTAQTLLNTVTYNADNNVTGWQWSDGKARTIGYDANGLVSSYTLGDPNGTGNAAGLLRTLTRDTAGRITGYTHTNNGTAQSGLNQTFGYDNLNRLLTATVAGTSMAYSYDENGNRTSKTVGGTTYTNTIATTSNRLTQTQDVGGTATVTHDAAGHVTNDGTNAYTYSDRGRMGNATTSGGTAVYLYNGLNQRASKSGPTSLVPSGASY
ncbi:Ig-like domain repeat protein, partial [Ramlibacter sp.]|uniref:Ig-like domain repeat protein n=1 Tax=Ramlibacter sp. TaxID=1917967 RepID=UPI0017D57D3A